MLFNSLVFLIFAAIFFSMWRYASRGRNVRFGYIIFFSSVFYGWWNWRYLFLLVGSGVIDYLAALGMRRYPQRKRIFLIASIAANVGSLAVFKYSVFFATNIELLAAQLGYHLDLVSALPAFVAVLPVGISFYTFQSMSYTFDVYRGLLEPTRNPLHSFAYLSMFPQLVAGPIVRARQILGDLNEPPVMSESRRWQGTKLIATGYFMKVVLADNLAPLVNAAFARQVSSAGPLFWWLVMLGFAFQIYFDFAGYSRIARGIAQWMGYDFPDNFRHPYSAASLQEFWQRWHITLSTWFRDYVYIPLGGSRVGTARAHLNLWIVMLVSALWHGAAWRFVMWGAIHAAFYSFERITHWSQRVRRIPWIGLGLAVVMTNVVVILAWVFFRASNIAQGFQIMGAMLRLDRLGAAMPASSGQLLLLCLFAIAFELGLLAVEHPATAPQIQRIRFAAVPLVGLLFAASILFRGLARPLSTSSFRAMTSHAA